MMGLMGRSSKSGKLKMVGNLAISRIAILRKHHSVRCSQARSDVIQLLQQGDQEHALLRVEYVIKEQGTLDSFDVIEYCCHLLRDRSEIIKSSRECPDELKEAISSLIFAASRCGGFPELQEIRSILFTCRFGKQLADSAAESRNDSTVYPKIIQGFSRKQTSLETRQNVLKQMAIENGICLPTVSIDHEAFNIASEEQQQQSMHDRTNEAVGES